MKNLLSTFLGIALITLLIQTTYSQSTTFTYQGKLNDATLAANGTYDFRFSLFDNGLSAQVGPLLTRTNVPVTNGIFTVQLDFTSGTINPFSSGADLSLQIEVKRSADVGFTLLTPTQKINSAPYSIRSLSSAASESAVDAQKLGGVAAAQYVVTTDTRMSDARDPLAGSSSYIQNNNGSPQPANFSINGVGAASILNAATFYTIQGARVLSADAGGGCGGGFNTAFANAGSNNTFAGNLAGHVNTSGFSNSFYGSGAGVNNGGGLQNSFFGANAGSANLSGNGNSFFGESSGTNNKASANAFFGNGSGAGNTSGIENSFFGFQSGNSTVVGSQNSFFGYRSGLGNTGDSNSFFGDRSGLSNTTGHDNDFYGSGAGAANTTGVFNTFFGSGAGAANTTSSNNSFFGADAGNKNTGGSSNAFFGSGSGFGNTNGVANSFFGINAGIANTTGGGNTFLGQNSGAGNLIGGNNTFVGAGAGNFLINAGTENGNTMIGESTGYLTGVTNATAIGIRATATASNTINLGTASETTNVWGKLFINALGNAGGTALCLNSSNLVSFCSSSIRYKKDLSAFTGGLDLVRRLQPISFTWKDGDMRDIGLKAEDVAQWEPLLVTYNPKGEIEGVKYDRIAVVLLNAVKEQQAQIESLSAKVVKQGEQLRQQQEVIEGLRIVVCKGHSGLNICQKAGEGKRR